MAEGTPLQKWICQFAQEWELHTHLDIITEVPYNNNQQRNKLYPGILGYDVYCRTNSTVLDFWNFEFLIFNELLNFTIVPYGETKNLNYLENDGPQSETEWHVGLGGEYSMYTRYFWHSSDLGHSGVFRCILIFGKPVSQKWMVVTRAKWSEIWASGVNIQCIQDTCEAKCFR